MRDDDTDEAEGVRPHVSAQRSADEWSSDEPADEWSSSDSASSGSEWSSSADGWPGAASSPTAEAWSGGGGDVSGGVESAGAGWSSGGGEPVGAGWSSGGGEPVATESPGAQWSSGGEVSPGAEWSSGGGEDTEEGGSFDTQIKPLIEAGLPFAGGPVEMGSDAIDEISELYETYLKPLVDAGEDPAAGFLDPDTGVASDTARCLLGLVVSLGASRVAPILLLLGVVSWKDIMNNPFFIETMCACLPDEAVLEVTRDLALSGRARLHFDHYLQGSGESMPIDVTDLVRRDDGVRERMVDEIQRIGKKQVTGPPSGFAGSFTIHQGDYAITEHQFAYGTVDVNFDVDDSEEAREINSTSPEHTAMISVNLFGIYDWHPQENRPTKCIHAAAERMKANGAKDFTMDGAATVGLVLGPRLTPLVGSAP
jgi:hypothetical protein